MNFFQKQKNINDSKVLIRTFVAKELTEAHFVANALIKDGRNRVTIWQHPGIGQLPTYAVTWDEPARNQAMGSL